MVAQIDEKQLAMVALPMHPAGKFRSLANIGFGELIAVVGTVGMHKCLVY